VFAAYLPRTATEHLLRSELKQAKKGRGGIQTAADLKNTVSQVRENGYATVDGNVIPGLRAFAAPVLDSQNEAAAVITVLSASEDVLDVDHGYIADLVALCASISMEVGAGNFRR
jgi:DNA-binding IclR family transcriptional regulator